MANQKVVKFPATASAGAVAVSNRTKFAELWAAAGRAAEDMFEAERTGDANAFRNAQVRWNKAMRVACRLVPAGERLLMS